MSYGKLATKWEDILHILNVHKIPAEEHQVVDR